MIIRVLVLQPRRFQEIPRDSKTNWLGNTSSTAPSRKSRPRGYPKRPCLLPRKKAADGQRPCARVIRPCGVEAVVAVHLRPDRHRSARAPAPQPPPLCKNMFWGRSKVCFGALHSSECGGAAAHRDVPKPVASSVRLDPHRAVVRRQLLLRTVQQHTPRFSGPPSSAPGENTQMGCGGGKGAGTPCRSPPRTDHTPLTSHRAGSLRVRPAPNSANPQVSALPVSLSRLLSPLPAQRVGGSQGGADQPISIEPSSWGCRSEDQPTHLDRGRLSRQHNPRQS